MQYIQYNENKQRGTFDFPFEFYHIDETHPQYEMPYHWHVEYEVIRVIKGTLFVTLDEKEFPAKEGDIIFVNGGVLHSGIPKDCTYECIVFDLNAFLKHNPSCKPYIQKIIDHSVVVFHHFHPENEVVSQIMEHLFRSFEEKKTGYELNIFGVFYRFFGLIYENKFFFTDVPQTRRDFKRIFQLKKVLEYMDNNYQNPITLDDLSNAAGMSRKYFCRFFHEMTHKTPIDYLNYQRIEHACYQLASTDQTSTEIAYNCGFNDLSYFIKTFRKYKQTTPKKYLQDESPRYAKQSGKGSGKSPICQAIGER